MRRFVHNIILFALVAAVGVWLLLLATGWTRKVSNVRYNLGIDDHTFLRAREAEQVGQVEVLFVGSSHSYRTFDPRILEAKGISSFNLGSSMQTPIQTEVLLHRYFEGLRPRVVVMEVHPDVMRSEGVESSLYWFCNAKPSIHNLPLLLQSDNAKVWCTALCASVYNTLSPHFRHYEEPVELRYNIYVSGGYVERPDHGAVPPELPLQTTRPNPKQLQALRRIVDWVEAQGAKCILVEVPDAEALEVLYDDPVWFRCLMANYADFYYFRPEGLVDSLHFWDECHLNQAGVELYCPYVADILRPYLGR